VASGVLEAGYGYDHSCFLGVDKIVQCSGLNENGQLGDGSTSNTNTFSIVPNLPETSILAVGHSHNCAMLLDTSIHCWGWGLNGELGNGVSAQVNAVPVPATEFNIPGGSAIVQLVATFVNTYVDIVWISLYDINFVI
jgi:alpha-tubulin suppressor-like RCC1 family protein